MSVSSAAFAVAVICLFGVVALVGVSAYIDHHREKQSTPIPTEAEGRPPTGMCSCGGKLVDGQCPWCQHFDEVMGQ